MSHFLRALEPFASTQECIAWRELVDRKAEPMLQKVDHAANAAAKEKERRSREKEIQEGALARRKKEWEETSATDWQLVGQEVAVVGLRVVRGRDWIFGDRDGGVGNIGTITKVEAARAFVHWDFFGVVKCRAGVSDKYDLYVHCPSTLPASATTDPAPEVDHPVADSAVSKAPEVDHPVADSAVSKFLKKGTRVQITQGHSDTHLESKRWGKMRVGAVVEVEANAVKVRLNDRAPETQPQQRKMCLARLQSYVNAPVVVVGFQSIFLQERFTRRQYVAYSEQARSFIFLVGFGLMLAGIVGASVSFVYAKQVRVCVSGLHEHHEHSDSNCQTAK
jgi:hypothetical protein